MNDSSLIINVPFTLTYCLLEIGSKSSRICLSSSEGRTDTFA
jgi:hypothetical protein